MREAIVAGLLVEVGKAKERCRWELKTSSRPPLGEEG